MADNILVTQGSGTTMATDDVGGVQYPRVKMSIGADGSAADVSSSNPIPSDIKTIEGIIDANNSTTTPLGAGGNFTGAWTDVKNFNSINLGVYSDQASATDGLRVEYSSDGVTVHHYHLWTFPGGANGIGYQLAVEFRYFRINYTNGGTAQGSFVVQSNLKPTALTPSSYRASSTFSSQSQVLLTKGIIVGETTGGGGGYVSVKVNPSGALTTETSVTSSVLPTGAATETTLSAVNGKLPATLGQKTMANSMAVAIASDQSGVPVTDNGGSLTVDGSVSATQSGTWNINNISGTVSLPTGAATETTLSVVSGKLPATLGQKTMANSMAVAIASDQSAVPASQSGTWDINNISGTVSLPTGAATAANQTTGNSSLSSIDSKIPTLVSGNQPVLTRLEKKDGTIVDARATETDSVSVGNFIQKFRDGFVTAQPDLTIWDEAWTNQGSGFVSAGGNSAGSAYMRISMCPLEKGSQYLLTTKNAFSFPYRKGYGLSVSQRIIGQEIEVAEVGVDGSNVVETISPVADLSISGTVSITSNVATINFAAAHNLRGGDRVILVNNTEPRLNVGPVVVTVVTATHITVPCTLANGTYTAGGVVRWADPFAYAKNAIGMLYENATATNASFVARRNGAKFRSLNSTVSTTAATQANTSPFTDSFNSAGDMELVVNMEEAFYSARASDAISAPTGGTRYSQGIPDEENQYKTRLRIKSLDNLTVPVGRIVSIQKTGTTTATVTTDVAHTLATTDFVQIYGVANQAASAFPNLTAQTAVSAVLSPTQFQVVIGTASTVTSAGGAVWKVQGSVLAPGVVTMAAQSISRTSNVLTIIGSANWAGLLPGQYIHLYGCDATSMGLYDGPYKVLRTSTTTLEVESVGADFTSIACGGAIIVRTDVRLHYIRIADYTRHAVEMAGARGNIDAARAQAITGAVTVSSGTVTTVSAVTAAALAIPGTVADVASAALTTTTTTSAITPSAGICYQVNIPVTAVTGTGPTLDVAIEESDDAGTNWFKVYDFPRITATGMFRSPILRLRGNRVRYVQTVAGTSPSFTRAVNRLQISNPGSQIVQIIDRSIVPNTLNSTSPSLYVEGCQDFNLVVRCTAQTTAATIDFQISDDNTNWETITGMSITTAVGSVRTRIENIQTRFARAIVSAAGTGITLGELSIKGVGV